MEPVESRSNSHRKASILRTRLEWTIAMADTVFWHRVKSSSQIYLVIADTRYFFAEK